MFFFQAANMLHGCLVHVAGSFHRLQIVRSLFHSAGAQFLLPHTPRFYVWSLGITIMPCSQDKREGRGAQGLCSSHHGDLQVCTAASLLGHSDHSCLCFLYSFLHSTSFLLFSRPNSGRNLVRKDSVRMNGVLLIRLVYFQHQDSVLHFLHMWLELTPFREVTVLEKGNQWKGDDVGAKRGQRGRSW